MSDSFSNLNPDISLIVPFYNEESSVHELFQRLFSVMGRVGLSYEIICIDDGSTDRTYKLLLAERERDLRIKPVRFVRNFGKEAALTCGLRLASGRAAITMDSDLQHPPEVIADLVRAWQNGSKMVYGIRRNRDTDGPLRRLFSRAFYSLFRHIADIRLPEGAGDLRLLDRAVIDSVNALPERNRFMKGLMTWAGFDYAEVQFDVAPRTGGYSHWDFFRLVRFAFDGIASFSTVPLRIWTWGGLHHLPRRNCLWRVPRVTHALVWCRCSGLRFAHGCHPVFGRHPDAEPRRNRRISCAHFHRSQSTSCLPHRGQARLRCSSSAYALVYPRTLRSPHLWFWGFALLHFLLWTLVPWSVNPNAPLDVIEGYAWGHEWLIGTYKHPPMQAWWLEILAILTDHASWVHFLASQIAVVVAFWAVWDTARHLMNGTKALLGVLLLEGVIYFNFTSTEFNPNVLLLPFWSLICRSYYRAIKFDKISDWLLLGLWIAGGSLQQI